MMTLQLTLNLVMSGSRVESPSYDLAADLKAGSVRVNSREP